jgi:hypothetical protein
MRPIDTIGRGARRARRKTEGDEKDEGNYPGAMEQGYSMQSQPRE